MKTKFKGTPGPWKNNGPFVYDEYGCRITTINVRPSDREGYSNARLIAAAPELLEALKELVAAWESGLTKAIPALNQEPAYRKAKQIITKAIGE